MLASIALIGLLVAADRPFVARGKDLLYARRADGSFVYVREGIRELFDSAGASLVIYEEASRSRIVFPYSRQEYSQRVTALDNEKCVVGGWRAGGIIAGRRVKRQTIRYAPS